MSIHFNPFADYLTKARAEAEAYELALGTYKLVNDGSVLPLAETSEAKEEFTRISSLVSSVGPKILTRKQDGILGPITISGSDEIRKYFDEETDLRFLVEKVIRDSIIKGSMGLAIGVDEMGETYVYRLGGFITRLYSSIDVDKEIGILQIEHTGDGSYDVRLFTENRVDQWLGIRQLGMINWDKPHHTYENDVDYVAFFADYQSDDTGMSIGEMEQLVPILRGIMAVEARIHRVSEIFGFPKAVISGTVQEDDNHGPTSVFKVSEGGSVTYLTPASFDNLIRQKVDLFNELNEIATLPNGFVGRGNQPSGEAITEANSAFNSSITRYARLLSRLLTNAFYEFFKAIGMSTDGFSITVTPNRVSDAQGELDKAIILLEKGLLTPQFVVGLVQKIYDVNDDIAKQILSRYESFNQLITPENILGEV